MAWHAKAVVRSIYDIDDPDLGDDLQDDSCPPEVHSLGRTLLRWLDQITAWHQARVSNGHRSGQQPNQTDRLPVPSVPQLPDPSSALCRTDRSFSPPSHP